MHAHFLNFVYLLLFNYLFCFTKITNGAEIGFQACVHWKRRRNKQLFTPANTNPSGGDKQDLLLSYFLKLLSSPSIKRFNFCIEESAHILARSEHIRLYVVLLSEGKMVLSNNEPSS